MSIPQGRQPAIDAISHQRICAAVSAALRPRMQGRGTNNISDVHRATGIALSSLKAYRNGEAAPPVESLLRLAAYFGPGFLDPLLDLVGMVAVPVTCAAQPPDHIGLLRDTQAAGAAIAGGLQPGGGLDHRALPDTERAIRALQSRAAAWLEAGRRMTRYLRPGRATAVNNDRREAA